MVVNFTYTKMYVVNYIKQSVFVAIPAHLRLETLKSIKMYIFLVRLESGILKMKTLSSATS